MTWTAGALGTGVDGQSTVPTEYHVYIAEDESYATVPDLVAAETALITANTESIFTRLTEKVTYTVVIVAVNTVNNDKRSEPGYSSFMITDYLPHIKALDEIRELDREYTLQFTEPINLAGTQNDLLAGIKISVNGGQQEAVAGAQVRASEILLEMQTIFPGQTLSIEIDAGLVSDNTGKVNEAKNFELTVAKQLSGEVRTLVGVSSGLHGYIDGIGSSARLYMPHSFAFDNEGNIIIPDTYNYRMRKMDMTTGMVSTIAGTGAPGYINGLAERAKFWILWELE